MDKPPDPDFGPHPELNREPLQTGNLPETLTDRDSRLARTPDWIITRLSATWLLLLIVALLIGIGGMVAWYLQTIPLWPIEELT